MSTYSPYHTAKVLEFEAGERLIFANTEKPISVNPITHTVLPGETLQSISYKYYGDSGYWAQILLANDLLNPLAELEAGKQLIIP